MGKTLIRFFKQEKIIAFAVGRKTRSKEKILDESDIIFISLPSEFISYAVSLLDSVDISKKLIVSLGSCMIPDAKAMKKIKGPILHIHQLFGPKTFPFLGQRMIFAGKTKHEGAVFLKKIFRKNKVLISEMDPQKHDKIMACTQALSQFSIISLGAALSHSGYSKKELMDASTVTFRMNVDAIKRITSQKAALWSHLQIENIFAGRSLDHFLEASRMFRKFAENKDKKGFEKAFDKMAGFWNN